MRTSRLRKGKGDQLCVAQESVESKKKKKKGRKRQNGKRIKHITQNLKMETKV
jgi:hypothetical protein